MIRECSQNCDLVPVPCPMPRQLSGASSGRSHLRRKVLRNVENLHRFLVVAELECTLVAQRPGTLGAAAGIGFPAVSVSGEKLVPGEAVHHAQLHDVQLMIEGTRYHGQAGTRLLVQRPEAEVVAGE